MTTAEMAKPKPGTRAVTRRIAPGCEERCPHCGDRVKFQAKSQSLRMVICNVYKRSVWSRTEIWHETCYDEAEHPYGVPDTSAPLKYS